MDGGAWQATVYGVMRIVHNLATKPPTTTSTTGEQLNGYKQALFDMFWI